MREQQLSQARRRNGRVAGDRVRVRALCRREGGQQWLVVGVALRWRATPALASGSLGQGQIENSTGLWVGTPGFSIRSPLSSMLMRDKDRWIDIFYIVSRETSRAPAQKSKPP